MTEIILTLFILAFLALWIHPRLSLVLTASVLLISVYYSKIQLIAFVFLGLFIALAYLFQHSLKSNKTIIWISLIVLSFAFGLHLIPGFTPWELVTSNQTSYFLKIDKILVGLILLSITFPMFISAKGFIKSFHQTGAIFAVTIILTLGLAYFFNKLDFTLNQHSNLLLSGVFLLFFTCVVEEAVFRGLIQNYLQQLLVNHQRSNLLAITFTSLLFAFVHIGWGFIFSILAFIASIGYGLAFQKNKRLEPAILLHFCISFLFFKIFTPVTT